jgi:pilus assembly protein FimV
MSSALDLVRQLWWVAAAAVMGLVLVVALRSWRSRRQAEFDDSLNRLALAGSGLGPLSVEHGFTTNDGMGPLEGVVDEPFTVEDTGRFPVTASRAPIAEDLPPVRSNEAPQGFQGFQEGSDPLAEADFHIGYGMYDQAAELLRAAVEHEPGRRDLRLKLLEVFFETGNRDEFLQLAEELVHTRDQAGPGEWEKIAIMGRQLAPEDPLFAESDDFNVAAAGVDLDLEAGDQQVDYDLGGVPDEQQIEFDNAMLDEGMVEEGSVETDIDYSRPPPATMLRQPQGGAEELQPEGAFELELDSQDGELDIESALQEAELELNGAQGPDSDATMVAGFDERSRRVMEAAAQRRALQDTALVEEEPEAAMDPMDQWAAHEDIDSMPMDAGATDASQLGNMRGAARADRDMGRYDLNDAANGPYSNGANGEALAEDDMALPDLEPVTMSEVGTKLDLARAYVDMGDPEGARNILEEVLNEGSLAQKQEAQLLLEGLPG